MCLKICLRMESLPQVICSIQYEHIHNTPEHPVSVFITTFTNIDPSEYYCVLESL